MNANEIKNLICDLQDLHNRLVANYNDNVPFEQLEEDRLVVSDTLDLINQYEEKVKKCEKVEHFADKTIATLQAENERLIGEVMTYKVRWAKAETRIEKAKAEAIKECIEKVREKLDDCRTVTDYVYQGYDTGDVRNMLDNLLKEMGVE